MPNLTNQLESFDLTTAERVNGIRDVTETEDSRTELMASMITEVSSHVGEFLGVHLKRAERTETYELRRFSKLITLDAVDVSSSGLVVKVAGTPDDLTNAVELDAGEDFALNARTGVIRLFGNQPYAPAYVSVTYTGGYFALMSEIGTKHFWLTSAVEKQVVYRLQRLATQGGNVISNPGGGSSYTSAYDFLPDVERVLRAHRREHV